MNYELSLEEYIPIFSSTLVLSGRLILSKVPQLGLSCLSILQGWHNLNYYGYGVPLVPTKVLGSTT